MKAFPNSLKELLMTTDTSNKDWISKMFFEKKSIIIDDRYIVEFPDFSKDIFTNTLVSQLFPGITFTQDVVVIDKKSETNNPSNAQMIITYHYDLNSFSTCIKFSTDKVTVFQTAEIYE